MPFGRIHITHSRIFNALIYFYVTTKSLDELVQQSRRLVPCPSSLPPSDIGVIFGVQVEGTLLQVLIQ
jgi:hypothetical protein